MAEDEKILDKIKKLLALGESANVNESQNAMLKAQELMVKNGISMRDVQIQKQDKEISNKSAVQAGRFPWYAYNLAAIIADNFKCYSIINSTNGVKSQNFVGLKDDVETAITVYNFAFIYLKGQMKNYKLQCVQKIPPYAKHDKSLINAYTNDFARGFLNGLRKKFADQVDQNKWGLVLVKDKAVIDSFNDMKLTERKKSRVTTADDNEAWEVGFRKGRNFEMVTGCLK